MLGVSKMESDSEGTYRLCITLGETNSLVHGKISESHFEGIIHVPG